MAVKDLTGMRFGRYTVIRRVENDKHANAVWLCRCDCGNEKAVVGSALRKGAVVSCGCYHKEDVSKRFTKHGMAKTRIRNIWNHVKQRCTNPNDRAFPYYGGRGITVCEEWKNDFVSFYNWAMQNGYTDELTLDRIDTNGNYCPSNCRWVTRKEQQNNTRYVHNYTINGKTKSIAEWCRIYNAPYERVRRRVVDEGWNIVDAMTAPALDAHGKPRKK